MQVSVCCAAVTTACVSYIVVKFKWLVYLLTFYTVAYITIFVVKNLFIFITFSCTINILL